VDTGVGMAGGRLLALFFVSVALLDLHEGRLDVFEVSSSTIAVR